LLQSFGIDEAAGVSRTDFHRLCPALVQQAAADACGDPETTSAPTNRTRPSDGEGIENARGTDSEKWEGTGGLWVRIRLVSIGYKMR